MMLRPLARLGLVAAAVLASSCTPRSEGPPATASTAAPGGTAGAPAEEPPGADTLVVASQADADSFVSVVYQSATDGAYIDNMFRRLTDEEFDCRTIYEPGLATFEHAADGLSITFKLIPDQKWSDGQPITVDDVVFTYDLIADPAVASPRLEFVEKMKPDARPRVIDAQTVRFEFTEAYDRTTQMSHCSMNILPKHALSQYDRASLRGTDFDKAPIVSGAWRVGKWEKGSTLELVPNENYTGPNPATLKRVIFKVIPEYATRLIELEKGSVDMIENIQTMEDIGRLAKNPDIKLYRRGWRFNDYIGWNLRNPLFADKTVRQALTMAIDRDKLIRDLLTTETGEKLGRPSFGTITPELCDYSVEGVITPFPFDPAKAKEMLASAGWTDSNADGILDKGGQPFRFTLLTNSGNARRAKAMIIVQSNLKDVGIDAQIEYAESNTFFERTRKKDFEAALSGWSAASYVDPTPLWHSDRDGKKREFNFCSYDSPVADELIDRGMRTPKLEDQQPIWQELQKVIYDDQPYTFLYWRDEVVPIHARVKDVKCDLLGHIHDLNEWKVPQSQVKYKF
jgi:peptide/nickel transport system substrate-binding protein